MNNFNILRLCCLIQDRDAQDLKRTVISIICEILYENNNTEIPADELFVKTNEKFHTQLDRDFFENLLLKSSSFETINTDNSPFVKLTRQKFNEIDKEIADFSIEPHIEKFLDQKGHSPEYKEKIIEILFQSIYENIYTFNPEKINTIIPQNLSERFSQNELDAFNEFLEFNEPAKNRCLYNQFVKAIEFAILTSGKGVSHFTDSIYKDKSYLLDTNIIFRLIGVGGVERQTTITELLKSCIKQGIKFEYSYHTLQELNKKLEQCVIDIQRAESSSKISIIEGAIERNPQYFNDDFITQYCRLRIEKTVSSPEQYEIEMKARFKSLCKDLNIAQANHNIKVEDYEKNLLATSLIKSRKEISSYFRYTNNQAKVDAYNVMYVRKRRGSNNYNYADVKSFYLTTDRGLNKILSLENNTKIPETILPSQLFVIHNPLSTDSSKEPDYKTFFRFLKRRTSEFKLRGKDVINYITQARIFTSDSTRIVSLIEAYSDQRYKHSISNSVEEAGFISFKDYSQTYFDKKEAELSGIKSSYDQIKGKSEIELNLALRKSKNIARGIDTGITLILLPTIALLLKFYSKLDAFIIVITLLAMEVAKFILSSRTNFLKNLWRNLFRSRIKKSPYYKLTSDEDYVLKGIEVIDASADNIWK